MAKHRIGIRMKLNGRCCSSGCVDIVSYYQRWGRWVSVSSSILKRCCQCDFSETFKWRQNIVEPCRNLKYSIRCLLWWQIITRWNLNTGVLYIKHFILDVWRGSEYPSAAKQGKGKMFKTNSRRRNVKCKSTWYHMFWNISMILANVWLPNVRLKNLWSSSA